MYILKEDEAKEISKKFRNQYLAETIGVSKQYISYIFHRKKHISKKLAYAFTKAVDNNSEILDLFEDVR